jgi:hypothetical protein
MYDDLLVDLYHDAEMKKIERDIKHEKYRLEEIERQKSYEGLTQEELENLKREEKSKNIKTQIKIKFKFKS